MKKVLPLIVLAFALAGCVQSKIVDVPTRAYARYSLALGLAAVDEEAARVQIHTEAKGDSGLLASGTLAFRDCNIQNRLNWTCDEGNSMTSYYRYTMRNGIFRASWAASGDAGKIQIVAISGAMRWVYRFGLKTPDMKLLTQYR